MTERAPAAFWQRLSRLLSADDLRAVREAYEEPLCRAVRINTLKCPEARWEALRPWPHAPFAAEGRLSPAGWKAGTDPWHHAGAYYAQEPSAMAPVTVLSPRPGERVLDLCAAPGGKSTQIASALRGQGVLWANDPVWDRAIVLRQNLERCGVSNAVVSSAAPADVAVALEGQGDAVLVDAPCSGEGMFRKEEAALTQWSEEYVALCARRQAAILEEAARTVAPGGRLVYSTCTLSPEEDELVIARFLHRHAEFVLEPVRLPDGRPGLPWSTVRAFCLPDVAYGDGAPTELTWRIWPGQGGEGHFIARLRKRGEAEGVAAPLSAPTAIPEPARTWCDEMFTYVPEGVWTTVGETVWWRSPAVAAWMDERVAVRLSLPAVGVAVGTVRGKRLEPCHAAFMAMPPVLCRQCVNWSLDDDRLTAFLRGETPPCDGRGWTAVAAQGVVTGGGKVSNGVLKNHYPKGLRLRG